MMLNRMFYTLNGILWPNGLTTRINPLKVCFFKGYRPVDKSAKKS